MIWLGKEFNLLFFLSDSSEEEGNGTSDDGNSGTSSANNPFTSPLGGFVYGDVVNPFSGKYYLTYRWFHVKKVHFSWNQLL